MELKGRRIIVTGGTSGIGRELVDLLAAENEVLVIARASSRLEALGSVYGNVDTLAWDLSDSSRLVELNREKLVFGSFDVLINNAAIQVSGDFLGNDFDAVALVEEVALNLLAPCLLSRLFASGRPGVRGIILNVGSALSLVPKASAPVYCATKAGLRSVSRSLGYQLEGRGIKVLHAVLPLVDTEMCAGRGKGKIPARLAALRLIKCIEKERRETYIGKARLLAFIYRLLPWLAYRILKDS